MIIITRQVSGLFDEFYYFAKHYSWISNENEVKEIFMKVLEKFSAKNVNIDDMKQVKNFLQKEIFTISSSVNEASVDFEIYNRYNFIVSDLIKRKLVITQVTNTAATTSRPMISQQVTRKPVTKKKMNKRPHSWKPGKTPNSPHHFYPQSSSWLQEKLQDLQTGPIPSIEQSSLIDSGILL